LKPRPFFRPLPAAVLAALVVLGVGASVAAGGRNARGASADAVRRSEFPLVDARAKAPAIAVNPAQAALAKSLGADGFVDVDPVTGTPSAVARRDGFLTGPSPEDARAVVLDYVKAHPRVFRLDSDDIAGLRLIRDYSDVGGTRHLIWAQVSRGIPAFGNDLRASVTRDGRLVNVLGSPAPDLEAPAVAARLGAADALGATLKSVGLPNRVIRTRSVAGNARRTTRFVGGHDAELVLVYVGRGTRLAWRVTARAGIGEIYTAVIDASSGRLLFRANKVEPVNARIWDYYPGAASGGAQRDQDITGWLGPGATTLAGPNAHVFADLVDSPQNSAILGAGDREIGPSDGTNWNYSFTAYTHANGFCAPSGASTCSWNSYQSGGWDLDSNLEQNATQAFYFVNNYHDHLAAPPIGFDAAAGAFDSSDDPVIAQTDDGAKGPSDFLGANMPDSEHVDNANMFTPPDGTSPEMQMYLFTSFTGPSPPSGPVDPTPDVNGGDDASVVYHEYTHGLSNRLLTYADGWGALDAHQSASLGEAWSDWYAMDYLVEQGFQPDDPDIQGEVQIGSYVDGGNRLIRTEGLDCLRGTDPACPGSPTAGAGGYTFGDLGKVWPRGAEVHADGEIWAQTLWQLRRQLILAHGAVEGVARARTLVTRALQLSGPNPTFLKMRDWILQADIVETGGEDKNLIWSIFANRGMGFLAWTAGANSVSTVQDFSLPRSFTCLGRTATRVGTNGSETITGTSGADIIVGNGGKDTINGRGGNDLICGGFGADTLTGGAGADKLDAGPGNDTLQTKDGVRERTIRGGTGRDRVRKDRTDRTSSVERFF
jgi:extracellular elastinolytic metalloproteinase